MFCKLIIFYNPNKQCELKFSEKVLSSVSQILIWLGENYFLDPYFVA